MILALQAVKTAWAAPEFAARNLFDMTPQMLIADGSADKWLVDPPREGAFALAKALADIHQSRIAAADADLAIAQLANAQGWQAPQRIVYVSCNPETMARDLALLTQKGYRAEGFVPVDLFPQTAHCEVVGALSRP